DRAPGFRAFSAHALDREQHLLAVRTHADDASSEIDVAFRSSRTRTTVPSRISRTIGSSASGRVFQASQSLFTFRQTRLTTSLPIPSANSPFSARRTRRVLVPAK